MSSQLKRVTLVIDWSPSHVRALSLTGALLGEAESISELKGLVAGDAILLLSRRSAYVKTARLPNAKASDIGSIVKIQAAQLFPNVQGELAHGFLLTSDVDAEGRLAVLAAAPVSLLVQLYTEADLAGIRLHGAIPQSFGSIAIAKQLSVPTAAVIEGTPEGIGIDVIENGALAYSRVAPTDADIAIEVDRTFVAAGKVRGPVIATPGSAYSRPDFSFPQSSSAALASVLPEFETALLEPPAITEKREQSLVNNRARLAGLMALAAVGVIAVVWDGRDRAEQTVQKARVEYTNAVRSATKVRDTQVTKAGKTSAIALEVSRAFGPAQSTADVLTVLGNEAPNGVWLTGITYERGRDLTLRGTATTNEAVGAYMDSLNQNSRFRDVKLSFANQSLIEATSVVQFSITAHVVGNLPTVKSKKERGRK